VTRKLKAEFNPDTVQQYCILVQFVGSHTDHFTGKVAVSFLSSWFSWFHLLLFLNVYILYNDCTKVYYSLHYVTPVGTMFHESGFVVFWKHEYLEKTHLSCLVTTNQTQAGNWTRVALLRSECEITVETVLFYWTYYIEI